ncbi:MAG: MarR family winged helix-turn-helix transcriptional regulator [Candidatus Dormibacteria bacterium]
MSSPPRAPIGRALRRTMQAFRIAAEAELAPLGMSLPLANALIDLEEEDGISSAELSRRVSVTAQTMTHLVSSLMERGLVERRRHSSHGRILTVHLTPAGRRVVTRCTAISTGVERRMMRGFSMAERRRLLAVLERCADALDAG